MNEWQTSPSVASKKEEINSRTRSRTSVVADPQDSEDSDDDSFLRLNLNRRDHGDGRARVRRHRRPRGQLERRRGESRRQEQHSWRSPTVFVGGRRQESTSSSRREIRARPPDAQLSASILVVPGAY